MGDQDPNKEGDHAIGRSGNLGRGRKYVAKSRKCVRGEDWIRDLQRGSWNHVVGLQGRCQGYHRDSSDGYAILRERRLLERAPKPRSDNVCNIFSQLIYLTRFHAAEKQAKENNAAEKKGKGKGKGKEKAGHDLLFHSTALIPSWFFLRPRSSEQIPPATTDVTRSRIDCTISPPVFPPPSSALN